MVSVLSRMRVWVILLVALIVVSITFASRFLSNNKKSTAAPPAKKPPVARIFIQPKSQIIQPQHPFSVSVVVESDGDPISAVSLKLLFDKSMLTLDTPVVGNYFTNPLIFENSVDNKRGILVASVGSTTPTTQNGTFLFITGKFNPGASGDTDLIVLPDSKVTRSGSTTSILRQTGQATLKGLLY